MRVCLLTPTHVCRNPRLEKEASLLTDAGLDVRVVCVHRGTPEDDIDQALANRAQWRLSPLHLRNELGANFHRWVWSAARQAVYHRLSQATAARLGVDWAYSRCGPELARLATNERADLYIAHNLPALPAAARAAKRHGALLGFDAEDYHRGE